MKKYVYKYLQSGRNHAQHSRHGPHEHSTIIIDHLLISKPLQKGVFHANASKKNTKHKSKETKREVSDLYLPVLDHGFICPFTAYFSIFFNVLMMGLHVKFMFHSAFNGNSSYEKENVVIEAHKQTRDVFPPKSFRLRIIRLHKTLEK